MLTGDQLREKLRGPVVAMTTHFKQDYSVDLDAMRRLTEFYVEEKIATVIVTGSTGEFFSLTDDERRQVQKTVIDAARGSGMIVIAGTAHSGSHVTIELTRYAEDIGADGAMLLSACLAVPCGRPWLIARLNSGGLVLYLLIFPVRVRIPPDPIGAREGCFTEGVSSEEFHPRVLEVNELGGNDPPKEVRA